MSKRSLKVLVGNLGLDGHEIGAIVVARALRRAGHEVVYLGLCQTPETVVSAAVQEDVDLVAVGCLCGAHGLLVPRIVEGLERRRFRVPVIAGGTIPPEDARSLVERGVSRVFPPGSPTAEIVAAVEALGTAPTGAEGPAAM